MVARFFRGVENTRPWLTDLVSQAGLRIPRSQATEIGASIRAAAAMSRWNMACCATERKMGEPTDALGLPSAHSWLA
jgi:hypothetical protein